MSEKQFTDGGVLGARVVASVGRVRREAHFHRDNDRKLGGGIQGLECCGLSEDCGRGRGSREQRDFGCYFEVRGRKSKPEPFVHRRVRHPREFQSCLKQTPVPRGKIGPPAVKKSWE
jgi:hypothetical protein